MITIHMRRTLYREASALGVTPREYVQLATSVAKNIRESFGQGKQKDALQLLKMIQNPLFVVVLRTVAESFLKHTTSPSATDEKSVEKGNEPFESPQKPIARIQDMPESMWEFW